MFHTKIVVRRSFMYWSFKVNTESVHGSIRFAFHFCHEILFSHFMLLSIDIKYFTISTTCQALPKPHW